MKWSGRNFLVIIFSFLLCGASFGVNAQYTNTITDPVDTLDELAEASDKYKKKRSPAGAGLMSLIIPGTGQVYNKQYIKSAVFFGAWAAGLGLISYEWDRTTINPFTGTVTSTAKPGTGMIGAILFFGSMVISSLDAVISAKRINERYNLSFKNTSDHFNGPITAITLGIRLGPN